MNLIGSIKIAASSDIVWQAILSADVLLACIPGCIKMSGTAEDGFDVTVVQKVGPLKATFKGEVKLSDIVSHKSLNLTGQGKGGAAGFAKGGAKVHLEQLGKETVLHYNVEAMVGGKLAQLGSRIIDGFAKKMANQFFSNLQSQIEGPKADIGKQNKKEWLRKLVS